MLDSTETALFFDSSLQEKKLSLFEEVTPMTEMVPEVPFTTVLSDGLEMCFFLKNRPVAELPL